MAVRSDITKFVISQIEDEVQKGNSIIMGKHDTTVHFARYLNTIKRDIAITAGSALAMGLLTGGLGAVAVLGGKAAMYALTAAYRGYYRRKANNVRSELNRNNVSTLRRNSKNELVRDDRFEGFATGHLWYLLETQGLTDISNAYADLSEDFDALSGKWVHAAVEPMPGTVFANTPLTLKRKPTTCYEAMELYENISRIGYRFAQVSDSFAALDELVMYLTLMASESDADWTTRARRLWDGVTLMDTRKPDEVLTYLNGIVNSAGLRKHFGRLLGRVVDYTPWIFSILPQFVHQDPRYILAVAKKMKVQGAADLEQKLIDSVTKRSTDERVSSLAVETLKSGGKYAGDGLKDFSTTAMKGVVHLGDKVNSNAAAASAFKEAFTGLSTGVAAAVTIVVEKVAEAANSAWNDWKLESGQTLGLTGFRAQTRTERAITLKTVSKEQVEQWVKSVIALQDAYKKVKSGGGREECAEALLTYSAAYRSFYSTRVGDFFELVVQDANYFKTSIEKFLPTGVAAVDEFYCNHRAGSCSDDPTTCLVYLAMNGAEIGKQFKLAS